MADAKVEDGHEAKLALREGAGGTSSDALRESLALPEAATDRDVALALVGRISSVDLAAVAASGAKAQSDPRGMSLAHPVSSGDTSFLGQLGPSGHEALKELDDATDLQTLLAVLRAGGLFQRRAAALRLGDRMAEVKALPGDQQREMYAALDALRDVEIAYELRTCREALPGEAGKEARSIQKGVHERAEQLDAGVRAFWDGTATDEPFFVLSGDARAQQLLYLRDMSDLLTHHIAAMIEDETAPAGGAVQRTLVAAVCYSGDPRLVPALVHVLETGDSDLVVDAARALSRIEDPRVWPALLAAYERSVVHAERLALAAALGRIGDVRAVGYVRQRLRDNDEHLLLRSLEALGTTGEPDDVDDVLPMLRESHPLIATKAAQVLGRIGDGRVLKELRKAARESSVGAVRAAAEDAVGHVLARLSLKGEEPNEDASEDTGVDRLTALAARSSQDSAIVVVASYRHYLIGKLYKLLGMSDRALRRFEKASGVRPQWIMPLLVAAALHASRDEIAQALSAFRRALDLDRAAIEHNGAVIRNLARCFLRRSEQLEKEGRVAVARGLLDEVLSLDLRRVPSSLRFEIGRRHEVLRAAGSAS